MPNPATALIDKHLGPHFVERVQREVIGLLEDFWKDGAENLFGMDFVASFKRDRAGKFKFSSVSKTKEAAQVSAANMSGTAGASTKKGKPWHAEPGEISERMWGEGFVAPGGNTINAMLINPLGLTKEMSVLDLSAGLGGRMRGTAEETGAYITGMEPDAAIAARGMQLSVKAGKAKHAPIIHYDPAKLSLNRSYDCVIARETFYRVPDCPAFLAAIAKHSKPHAQVAFTDYIVDPEHLQTPAIMAWKNNEKLANPMGLVQTAEAWAKVGFTLRVHEDLTSFYKAEVLVGMKRLMSFLASDVVPDAETALSLRRRLDTWRYRMAAMDSGMKFYRFYGTKQ